MTMPLPVRQQIDDDLIERVARGIAKRTVPYMEWNEVHPNAQGGYRNFARYAIEALSEERT